MIQLPDIKNMTDRNKAFAVAGILGDIFGISSPVFLPWGKSPEYSVQSFPSVEIIDVEPADTVTNFGVPVYGTFVFREGTYNTYDKSTGRIVSKKMTGMVMPYSCVAEFSRAMVMTETNVLGTSGSVKEIYGLEDWHIRIRGLALDNSTWGSGLTAQEQINILLGWREICDAIDISGKIFNEKDIYRIAIKDMSIRPVEGRWGVIPFEIDAVSDEPIELMI